MKQIAIIIVIGLTFYNCKAQSPVLNMEVKSKMDSPNNSYYKDVNNVLNDFEGTWLYTNGNTSLRIVLTKSTMFNNGKYYEDLLVGGYQYIENGIEKVNTLEDANNTNIGYNAEIWGNSIHSTCKYLPVNDCVDGEKRVVLVIKDPNSEKHGGFLVIHKRTINGQEALKINIEMSYSGQTTDGELPKPSIPWQMHNIVLLKQ